MNIRRGGKGEERRPRDPILSWLAQGFCSLCPLHSSYA